MFDAWEHAFYLQYKNVKADFFNALWNIVNWPDVAARLAAARAVHRLTRHRRRPGFRPGGRHGVRSRPVASVANPSYVAIAPRNAPSPVGSRCG